jgi:hypothetical protein
LRLTSESEDAHVQVSDDPRVGTELAGYRIESLLGWGGMSVVYLAEDLRLKRRVALKLLAARLAEDESFRDRFLRESELAASIDHPNIVPIYEAGTTENLLFIAMRYVEGRDLKERLQRGRLDPADATGRREEDRSVRRRGHPSSRDRSVGGLRERRGSYGDRPDTGGDRSFGEHSECEKRGGRHRLPRGIRRLRRGTGDDLSGRRCDHRVDGRAG